MTLSPDSPRAKLHIPWFGLAALAAALVLPHFIYPVLAADILAWGLFAVAFDLMLGYAGLLSFGHAAFWGVSAYATAYGLSAFKLPVPLALLGGVAAALLIGLPISLLAIRRLGTYFAMTTLAFAQMVFFVAVQWTDVTGGENGVQGVPRPSLLGLEFENSLSTYYFVLLVAALGFAVAWRAVHSPFGQVLRAIRDNETRAKSVGYDTRQFKLTAMLISTGLAGLAGGLYTVNHGAVGLEVVQQTTSGSVVMMTILGGIGTLWGPVIGAGITLLLRDYLASTPGATGIVTGAVFVVVVLLFRRGVVGTILERLRR